ncbi:MAG: putative membrane protein YdbT with pleckstrin-like domain [Pirellulaceae bacterium]|jgi:uncharacterized membrane protein YdbT with pleckstrin-like domain
MHCESCGAELGEEAKFCHECGTGTKNAPAEAPSPSAPAPTPAEKMRGMTGGDDDDVEDQLWKGSYSAKAMFGSWIGGAVLTAVATGVGTYFGGMGTAVIGFFGGAAVIFGFLLSLLVYRRLSVSYNLTTQRFVHKSGILKQITDRIEVIDMDDVTFEQGIIQRMLNVGTIRISSSDRSHPELTLIGIDDVKNVADMIDDVRRKERRRRGLHIEAI